MFSREKKIPASRRGRNGVNPVRVNEVVLGDGGGGGGLGHRKKSENPKKFPIEFLSRIPFVLDVVT